MAQIRIENLKITIYDLKLSPRVFTFPVQKSPSREIIFENLNLEINDGEILAILGPTGCGKTTLLRFIAGLVKPTDGRIYFDNIDFTEVKTKDRKIGMVFQDYALYPHYTSKGNLAFKFLLKRIPESEIDEKVKETSKILGVGFESLLYKFPKNLSMGEKQKVALGRCIIGNPNVMLLDEPLSNLDAQERVKTRAKLKQLLSKFRVTTVYVTHDQREAFSLADRIAVMNECGEIEQIGTFDELYNKPKSVMVASFIGLPPMNIFDAQILGIKNINKKIAGIHPEDVILFEKKDKGFINLHGTVVRIDDLGFEKFVYVKIKDIEIVCKTKEKISLKVGAPVVISFPEKKLHFFDP